MQPSIQNWYINNTARIGVLIFKVFMDEVRVKWLTDGWEGIIEDSVLKSHQNDMPFNDWLQSLQATAALIVGTYMELDDASLHMHIKSNMNETLKGDTFCTKTHTEADFGKWMAAPKVLNDAHLETECKLKEMIEKDHTARLKHHRDHTLTTPS